MIHLWQFQYGTKGKMEHHHNKEYVSKADEIGIIIKCGRENEQELKADSLLMSAINKLPKILLLKPRNVASQLNKEGKSGKRFKFVCPECGHSCLAKYDSSFICGKCHDNSKKIIYYICQN